MIDSIIQGLFAILLVLLGAAINSLFSRKKNLAEVSKIKAETDNILLDRKIKEFEFLEKWKEIYNNQNQEELITKINIRIQENKRSNVHISLPEIDERILFIYKAKINIEKIIRDRVLSTSGGWLGCSTASFETFLTIGNESGILKDDFFYSYFDFIYFSRFLINKNSVSDDQFQSLQESIEIILSKIIEN